MAFILRSSKYGYNFLDLARRASITHRRKKILEYAKFSKFNELLTRTAATASPVPKYITPFSIEKNISHLHANLKANMVDLHIVEATLRSIKEKNVELVPSQLLLLLKCCGNAAFRDSEEKRIKMAKSIWQMAQESGTELDIAHYNSLIGVFIENNHKFSPEEILTNINLAGLKPNRVTYRHLLKAFCQNGDIEGAGKLLEKMKEQNYPINEYDFCSLIQCHCEAGDLDEAEKIFSVMKDRGIQPTPEPYVYLLCGYAKHGNIKKMEELLDDLNKQDIQMTDIYLLNIVYTLIINNQSHHVDAVLARIKKSNDYEKTLLKIVHRLLHKNKDEEALKLFEFMRKMGYLPEYIENQVMGIIEHFVFNRSPKEVIKICQKIEDLGWTTTAFSHALKKAILRMDLDFCSNLMQGLRKNAFPIRPHYFWPLIVRYSEQGNSGILSVLKVMKSLSVTPCINTVTTFIKDYYKFQGKYSTEIDILKKHGVKECHASLIAIIDAIGKRSINDAEHLASSYGIYRPHNQLLDLLARNIAKCSPFEDEKFVNILYCLAHDFSIYNTSSSQEGNETEGKEDELKELNMFFDNAITSLMSNCPEDVFLSVLQNASKKKIIIPPQTAASIRKNFTSPDVDVLLKEFVDSDEFELNEELLKKKILNATVVPKFLDPNGLINLANRNDLKAEKLWEEKGSEASLEEQIAIIAMFSRMEMYDKAFQVIDCLKNIQGTEDPLTLKKFRVSLHLLRNCGNVEKMIKAYNVAVDRGLIDEDHIIPVIRTILNCNDVNKAIAEYFSYFEKIKTVGVFLEVMNYLIPARNTEIIEKITEAFSRNTNENSALTALFTAYLANGFTTEARQLLENKSFVFQISVFLYWFLPAFVNSKKDFNEAIEIIKNLRPLDRTQVYASMLSRYKRENNRDKIKMLCLQCQEDSSTDPFFLEHLRQCVQNLEKDSNYSENDIVSEKESSNMMRWNEDKEYKKFQGLIRANKFTDEMLEKLIAGKMPISIARRVLPLLAAEGKTYEIILILNKYRFGRFIPEIATAMLKKDKVKEFLEFVTTLGSMKKYGGLYNCFVSQEETILNLVKTNEEFFEKFAELSKRCYEEGKYEALLVFFMKVCIQVPEKLAKVEELLDTEDSRIVSHFRNYCLSNMLLSSAEEMDFYKNVIGNEKVKSVFSEALDHFYDRVINFYNENGDLKTALSYLELAVKDGVSDKLNKRLLMSLKENTENKGTTFPHPYLLQKTA